MKTAAKRSECLKAYLTPKEMEAVCDSSRAAGLTLSEFTRRVCLGMKVGSREDARARHELLKVNADLGRLGGLLKQSLAYGYSEEVYKLLRDIDHIKNMLKEKVRAL